jgi:phage shock protein E
LAKELTKPKEGKMLKQTVIAAALAASTPTFAAEHWIDVRIPEQYQHEHIQAR